MADILFGGIIDSTLREGGQAPGIRFNRDQQLAVVRMLCGVGVEEIELGVASPRSPGLVPLVREASAIVGDTSSIALWCRCCKEDIRFARQCGPDTLSLSMPVSDIQIREKLHSSKRLVLERLARSIVMARDLGFSFVSVGLEDATRADRDFLLQAAAVAGSSGAARLRLADTVGIASPQEISRLVEMVKRKVAIPIGVHTHNDFGMATANGVAALESGARWVDATVLGLGERAGSCRLEEIVGYLSLCRGAGNYRPEMLPELCRKVAEAARVPVSGYHPLIGSNVFTCETGLHVHALAKNPGTYEPFDPVLLGRNRVLLFGGKTGKGAVRSSLAAHGYSLAEKEVEDLVVHLRHQAEQKDSALDGYGLVSLARARGLIK